MRLLLPLLLLCIALPACGQSGRSANRDPDAARLVFEDVPRFWHAWTLAREAADVDARAAIYEREYLAKGSPGLREFQRLRIEDGRQLAATVDRHPRYYEALRIATTRAKESEAEVRDVLDALALAWPDAVFPEVYFLVGRMNSGGTLADTGLLIGLDMFGITGETPIDELGDWHRAVVRPVAGLPAIVAHELVHYQQRYDGAKGSGTLLAIAINEGVADFVAERLAGATINAHVHEWAIPRERELWTEFRERMHGEETKGWVYDANPGGGRPADLGYFVGYRIAQCHAARATHQVEALRGLFEIDDFEAFLASSRYEGIPCSAP
jgi:hypothetical protein